MRLALEPVKGEAWIGDTRVDIAPLWSNGTLCVGPQNDTIIKPLSFGERNMILFAASKSDDPFSFCINEIIRLAVVKKSEFDPLVVSIIALKLSGADIQAPILSETIKLVLKYSGFSLDQINSKNASDIDELAIDLDSSKAYKKFVFLQDDNQQSLLRYMVESLLQRVDRESFDYYFSLSSLDKDAASVMNIHTKKHDFHEQVNNEDFTGADFLNPGNQKPLKINKLQDKIFEKQPIEPIQDPSGSSYIENDIMKNQQDSLHENLSIKNIQDPSGSSYIENDIMKNQQDSLHENLSIKNIQDQSGFSYNENNFMKDQQDSLHENLSIKNIQDQSGFSYNENNIMKNQQDSINKNLSIKNNFDRPTINQSTESINQSTESINQSTESINQSTESINQSTESINQAVDAYNQQEGIPFNNPSIITVKNKIINDVLTQSAAQRQMENIGNIHQKTASIGTVLSNNMNPADINKANTGQTAAAKQIFTQTGQRLSIPSSKYMLFSGSVEKSYVKDIFDMEETAFELGRLLSQEADLRGIDL